MSHDAVRTSAIRTRKSRLIPTERMLLNGMILVPLVGLVLFFVYPLITVAWHSLLLRDGSFGFGNYTAIMDTPGLLQATVNSVILGAATTVVCIVLGFAIAYSMERSAMRGKQVIRGALNLPLLAPSLVQGIGLLFILGRGGLVARWTGWDMNIYGFWGLLIADVFWALPQVVMILQAALRNADARYYDAAEVMGASSWRQFFDITLPNTKFGLLSAAFVAFVLTITDFGNAFVIGGNFNVLAMEIYNQVVGQLDFGMGSVVGIMLLLPSLVAVYIQRVASQRQFGGTAVGLIPMTPKPSAKRELILGTICWATAAIIVAVVAVVVFASFVRLWPYDMSLTLHNYSVDVSSGYSSLWTSLKISIGAAVIGVLVLFMLAFGVRHRTGALAKFTYFLAMMPVGVPGLVIGIAYIFAFNADASPLYVLYGTAALIAICNLYHYHTQGFLTMMTGMRAVPAELEDAVTCLGGGLRHVLRDAVLPFMLPTAISVFFYLFMRSMVTLSAVIFLVTASLNVAAVTVMKLEHAGFVTQAAAFSTWIMIVVAAAMLIMKLALGYMTRKVGTVGAG